MILPSRDFFPEYYQIIEYPIAFSQLQSKVKKGNYTGGKYENFINDVSRVFNNAKRYNNENSLVYQDALALEVRDLLRQTTELAGSCSFTRPSVSSKTCKRHHLYHEHSRSRRSSSGWEVQIDSLQSRLQQLGQLPLVLRRLHFGSGAARQRQRQYPPLPSLLLPPRSSSHLCCPPRRLMRHQLPLLTSMLPGNLLSSCTLRYPFLQSQTLARCKLLTLSPNICRRQLRRHQCQPLLTMRQCLRLLLIEFPRL